MQAKKYPIPSARSRTHMRRNILSTLETREDTDASWLNDVHPESPVAATQTQEHTVCYEDLPTMPLSALNPSLVARVTGHEEEAFDDKTVRLKKHTKARGRNSLDALIVLIAPVKHMSTLRMAVDECCSDGAEMLLQTMYNGLNGVMTIIYTKNAQDCLTRFETLCSSVSKKQSSLQTKLIRTQIAQSFHIVIVLSSEETITETAEVQLSKKDLSRL